MIYDGRSGDYLRHVHSQTTQLQERRKSLFASALPGAELSQYAGRRDCQICVLLSYSNPLADCRYALVPVHLLELCYTVY